ncbi:hypothetical protein QBC34DRAFT_285966, partial [Podospora aff. communis PSN243]
PILSAIALILYDQECSGSPPPYITTDENSLIPVRPRRSWWAYGSLFHLVQHMLFIDYGLPHEASRGSIFHGSNDLREAYPFLAEMCAYLTNFANRCRNGQLPSLREWKDLNSTLTRAFHCDLTPEGALALYYHYSHQHEDIQKSRSAGDVMGYMGVMQDLIDEIPLRGPDRLLRKLSVDVHFIIPRFIHPASRRSKLITAAEAIAAKYNLSINAPRIKDVEIPPFDSTHRDGYAKG